MTPRRRQTSKAGPAPKPIHKVLPAAGIVAASALAVVLAGRAPLFAPFPGVPEVEPDNLWTPPADSDVERVLWQPDEEKLAVVVLVGLLRQRQGAQ